MTWIPLQIRSQPDRSRSVRAAKDIALDVVQVQQFLSDISATRAQDGLDDGFKDAQRFADKFEHDFGVAAGVAEALHRPEISGCFPS